jgi:serine/threonine protein kinase
MNPGHEISEREWLLAELARRESGLAGEALEPAAEATLATIQAELDTLQADLHALPPLDPFGEESDCRRAVELVEQIGRGPEFSRAGSAAASEDADTALLEAIGPYRVLEQLGRGGMGSVYKAVHPKLKREVAVKVLPPGRLRDAAAVARFEREMEAVGALNHPNIVAAHDAGEVHGMHYLVMEYIDGLDLSSLVRRLGPLAIADACEIVRQAADGLQAAADRGMVHRDVKPSNLMLAETPAARGGATVKILDFGLARFGPLDALEHTPPGGDASNQELTASGLVMGTLRYMAPEQCARSHAVDARADVYSLGATLYKLLCGASPFAEERFDSPLALLTALASEDPPRVSTRRADVPPQVAAIVTRMLAKDPAARYATAAELARALAPWARGADLAGLLERARAAEPAGAASRAAQRQVVPRPSPPWRRAAGDGEARLPLWGRFAIVAVALAGVLAGLVLAVSHALRPRKDATPKTTAPAVTQAAELLQFAPNDPSFARSRAAAEWLASLRARFGLLTARQGFIELASGDPLPAEPFQLHTVNINGERQLTADDAARFRGLPLLRLFSASNSSLDDAGLRALGELPALEHLFLNASRVTDAGLPALGQFPTLTTLYLRETAVTDAGLESVGRLASLSELMLLGCQGVTDAGLAHLRGLSTLKTLYLEGTKATPRGVAALQAALPGCTIYSNYSSDEISHARDDNANRAK